VVWLVGALLLIWIAWGPVVLVVAGALLCVPRIRWWVQDRSHVERRTAARAAGAVAVLLALVVVVPDGWLPIPPAPGAWAGPAYVGRPATASPMAHDEVPQNPHRTPGVIEERSGPLGLQPEVDTSWFGMQRCGQLAATSTGALVALCTDRQGPALRLVDPDTMRPGPTHDLPERTSDDACAGDAFYLDAADRAVVTTTDRRVLAVRTTADGDPALTTDETWDLRPYIPFGDCVVALAPDWAGLVWWASQDGLVGTIAPGSGRIGVIDVDEPIRRGIATDAAGGAYVVTDDALHRLAAGRTGVPRDVWRAAYDGASGSAPVVLDGGLVAITDTVESQLGVRFVAREDGRQVCRQSVFEKGEGSTQSALASLGSGVVVTNNHGYSSPRSTLLGFTTSPGVARVDVTDGACVVRWTSDAVSPSSGVTASWTDGLVYAWTKRPSLAGVSAWYLTGIDVESGRSMFSVRTGTGLLAGSDHSTITLGEDGSAWLGTVAGLVRVRDRA
jgi:hypothetical protein